MEKPAETDTLLTAKLVAIIGEGHVVTGSGRAFFATDVFRSIELPAAVVQPGTMDDLRAVVETAYKAGYAIFVRGGGASYTDGYLPTTKRSILIDVGRLNRIMEINLRDMYVTVEVGLTWAELDRTLERQGLRTPFRGPFSGLTATVGGSISQHTVGFGVGQFGISAESVIAIEAVIGNGEWIRTGQAGSSVGAPFFRFYGPDLTGLFTGDCGALGVKARVTLKLMRRRPAFGAVSFEFSEFEAMHEAVIECAALGVDDKAFGLDRALQQGQIGKQSSVSARLDIAGAVLKDAGNLVSGAAKLARMGVAGAKALSNAQYAFHYMVEGLDGHDVKTRLGLLRKCALRHGREIPNTVPEIVHSMPFAPLHNIMGPKGERWVPMHGILPHSAVLSFHRESTAYIESFRSEMDRLGVYDGKMFGPIGAGAFLYEPAFYWTGEQTVYHTTMLDPEYARTLPVYDANPEGAKLVADIRNGLLDIYHAHGATHLQVGKFYPLLKDRDPASRVLLQAVKAAVDPDGLMNPGALGL